MLEKLGVPRDADFYLCGPTMFLRDLTAGLAALGIPDEHVHEEIFGAGKPITPGIAEASHAPPHPPDGPAGPGPRLSFARSGLNVCWDPKIYEPSRFCGGLRCAGALVVPHGCSAIRVKAD